MNRTAELKNINLMKTNPLKINRLPGILFVLIILELLCGVSFMPKRNLTDKERNLLKDVEKFNRDYGSKGVVIKNIKIDWMEPLVCNGLILKNSLIKNVELQRVDLRNTYIENSKIENVSISQKSDLRGSTFKNVRFKKFKIDDSDLEDSIFIDCEFIDCEYSFVTLGKEYRNCKFNKVKEIKGVDYFRTVITDSAFTNSKIKSAHYDTKLENVIFKNSTVESGFELEDSKNIQFINCLTNFSMSGKAENILVQNSKPDDQADIIFGGDMKNIVIKDCPLIAELEFWKGTFNNISIINCKDPTVRFYKINLSNLLIIGSLVQHLKFEESDVSGDNRIENSIIWGNFYGKSKIRNLTITNCEFEDYVDIVLSEFVSLRLNNNIYKSQAAEHPMYPGEIRHAIRGEKYIDSDKFPLKSIPFPEDNYYLKID